MHVGDTSYCMKCGNSGDLKVTQVNSNNSSGFNKSNDIGDD
jgi:hypothetical protein